MKNDIAIRVEHIYKRYQIGKSGAQQSFREMLSDLITGPFRRRATPVVPGAIRDGDGEPATDFWALKDVSLELRQGESLGIIGRNGSGKSTLLKIISRITRPTHGRIAVNGRLGSLLEVGTGFHPDLTGRENVFLNGAILGMSRGEIHKKFDAIVDFAEIEQFIDTPVKYYSSGMYVRLAFAVSAHMDPEILILDEVLAVGDTAFQQKCLERMQQVLRTGCTLLFVNHSMGSIRRMCEKCLYLKAGGVAIYGDSEDAIEQYMKDSVITKEVEAKEAEEIELRGNDDIMVEHVAVVTPDGQPEVTVGRPFELVVEYRVLRPRHRVVVNLALYTVDDTLVFVSLSDREPTWHGQEFPVGRYRSTVRIPAYVLNAGTYRARLLFIDHRAKHIFDLSKAIYFALEDTEPRYIEWTGRWLGITRPQLTWGTERISDQPEASDTAYDGNTQGSLLSR